MKMLMEIGPLPMRGALVMTVAMISPSRSDVSPAEQLRRSPRLVPPRGGGVSSRKLAYDFSSDERLHIAEDGHRRWAEEGTTHQGTPALSGVPRWVVPTWWAPFGSYSLQ